MLSDLDNLVEMEIEVSDKHYTIRSQTAGTVAKVFWCLWRCVTADAESMLKTVDTFDCKG